MSREARVLVFVHDATDGELVEMQMRKAHIRCTVQRVTQKEQFLKAMRSMPPDLAIVDGAYPRVDVASVMQSALQTTPGIPWVVLCTSQAEDALVRWMKAGAADVVTRKNYTRLGAVATELLTHRPGMQPPGAGHAAGVPGSVPGHRAPGVGLDAAARVPPAAAPRPVPGGAVPVPPPAQGIQPPRPGVGAPTPVPGPAHGAPPRVPPLTGRPGAAQHPGQTQAAQGPAPAPMHVAQPRAGSPPSPQPSGPFPASPVPPSGGAAEVQLDAFGEPIVTSPREGFPPAASPWGEIPAPQPGPEADAAPAHVASQTVPSAAGGPAQARPPEQPFREIIEHAADMVCMLDREGKRLYSNPIHAQVLDAPDRLQGTVAFVDVHPDDRLSVSDAYHAAVKQGKGFRIEYRLMDKTGSVRVVESLGTIIPYAGGEPRAVVVSRDVTERVQREQDREALLRALGPLTGERYFHNLVYVLADTLKVRYVLVSESLYQPYERVRSVAYWANGMLMPSFEYDLADTTCEAVYATRGPVHYPDSVQELFPKETALVEMEARSYLGVPLIGADSSIVGHLFIMDDKRMADPSRALHMLTQVAGRTAIEVQRLHQEQVFRGAESRLRFILESLSGGVLATDSLGIVTYISEQVGALLGCSSVDLIGKPLAQFVELSGEAGEATLPVDGEARVSLRCCDGTLRSSVLRASPLGDGTGKVTGTVFLVRPLAG